MDVTRDPEALAPTIAATPTGGSRPSALPEETLPAGERIGERYRIVELVGRGGQGDVYRAEDTEVAGHVVALKLMHRAARSDEERAFAMRELRMLAAVSHPAIVQFKDSGWYGARLWFVMPWLEGKNLEQLGRISRAEARRIFENVAAGVAALHAKGMRHQDIKPSNIFLAKIDGFDAPMPMLLDLGVAARDDDAPVAGSPDYFAPEVAAAWPIGGDAIGPQADVFALALTIRNALDPESAPTIDGFSRESLDARAKTPIPPPRGRDLAYLAPVMERWLALEPERRPTAAELLAELAVLTEPEDRRRDRLRLLQRVAPFAAALAIVLAIGGVLVHRELSAQEKAAEMAEAEQREAELAAQSAQEAAEAAQQAEREAIERAEGSAAEAQLREEQARAAIARVRTAQRALGRVTGDRERLEEALTELQAALAAAEQAREAETRARGELEHTARLAREQFEADRRELAEARDRAQQSAEQHEARARAADARMAELEQEAEASGVRAAQADVRVRELESRVAALEQELREERARPRAPAAVPDPVQEPAPTEPQQAVIIAAPPF